MGNKVCLSHLIRQDSPSYGGRDHIFIRTNSSIKKGETSNTSCWFFSNNHIGTHIDVPFHFSDTGKKTFEIPIHHFFFYNPQLIDIPCNEPRLIVPKDFESILTINQDADLILIRTGFEKYRTEDRYWNANPGLAPELADYLRVRFPRLRCVGFDFISLTSWKYRDIGRECHKAFLCPNHGEKEILVIEDMALAKIESSLKMVIVAPLFVEDGNGGAVTVIAELV